MKSSTEIPNTKHAGRARHSVRTVSRPPDDRAQVTRPALQDALLWRLVVGCSMLVVGCFPLLAQYAIDWDTIDGGGGTSTNGQYSLSGTLGQPDASSAMTNGQYSVTGGFWALPEAVQTVGAPALTITPAGAGQAQISWTPDTGTHWVLQENLNLATTNWINSTSGTNNPVIVPATVPTKFYRLFKP